MHSRLFGWGMCNTSKLCRIIYQIDTTFILKIISSKNKTKWFIHGMYLLPKGSVAADLKLFAVFHVFRRHIVSKLQWARSHHCSQCGSKLPPRRGNVQPQYRMIHYQTPPVAIKLGHCCRLFRKHHDPQDVDREVALRVGPRFRV